MRKKVNFILLVLLILLVKSGYCLNLDKVKINFLSGDYRAAILEGEKLLAKDAHSDELYYLLGLCYLKDANYLRASDIFEIILREFKNSKFKDEAQLGLGDTYFLRQDFDRAGDYYEGLLKDNPRTKLKALVYYRLSQNAFKKGDTAQGKEYLDKIKDEFPANPQLMANQDLYPISDSAAGIYYTVQVGSFSSATNAHNLTERLKQKNYPAYTEEINSAGALSYRVRVGKLRLLSEARDLENKLSQEGYPTKIYP